MKEKLKEAMDALNASTDKLGLCKYSAQSGVYSAIVTLMFEKLKDEDKIYYVSFIKEMSKHFNEKEEQNVN